MLNSGMAVFLDDILIYSCVVKEYFTLLEKVPVCLHQYTFYCKLKKCSFLHNSMVFFAFHVTPKGIGISDFNVQSLNE